MKTTNHFSWRGMYRDDLAAMAVMVIARMKAPARESLSMRPILLVASFHYTLCSGVEWLGAGYLGRVAL